MAIRNLTRKKVIASHVEVAKSYASKTLGLMFRKSLPEGHAMLMPFRTSGSSRHSIWMFCMRFPIDIIFLDSGKRVVAIHENAKPMGISPWTWKLYFPGKPSRYVIETNAGVVSKTGTEAGDILEF